jgi:hypothetical protein
MRLIPSNLLIQQCNSVQDVPTKTDGNTYVNSTSMSVTEDKHEHTVRLTVEGSSKPNCDHTVSVSIKDSCGKTYSHVLKIPASRDTDQKLPQPPLAQSTDLSSWEIAGVFDLDDAKSAPLVLTRKPPNWLWIHPDSRGDNWMGNDEDSLERPLTNDELLIKAHFDQTMARLSPSYIEDAYHRGLWLRRISRYAITGWESVECMKQFWELSDEWKNHYDSLVFDLAT